MLVEVPHFLGVGCRSAADEAAEEIMEVVDVAEQQFASALVARRVDRLRKVDDHRAIGAHKDIEIGEVAVDDPGAEHADDLADEVVKDGSGVGRIEVHVA